MIVGTLNVHGITAYRIDTLVDFLADKNIEVLCLQEIDRAVVDALVKRSWFRNSVWIDAGFRGNAVVSAHDIVESTSLKMTKD